MNTPQTVLEIANEQLVYKRAFEDLREDICCCLELLTGVARGNRKPQTYLCWLRKRGWNLKHPEVKKFMLDCTQLSHENRS